MVSSNTDLAEVQAYRGEMVVNPYHAILESM